MRHEGKVSDSDHDTSEAEEETDCTKVQVRYQNKEYLLRCCSLFL